MIYSVSLGSLNIPHTESGDPARTTLRRTTGNSIQRTHSNKEEHQRGNTNTRTNS